MNVEIGTEAAQFPEKEYINGIFVAVWVIVWVIILYKSHLRGEGESSKGQSREQSDCRWHLSCSHWCQSWATQRFSGSTWKKQDLVSSFIILPARQGFWQIFQGCASSSRIWQALQELGLFFQDSVSSVRVWHALQELVKFFPDSASSSKNLSALTGFGKLFPDLPVLPGFWQLSTALQAPLWFFQLGSGSSSRTLSALTAESSSISPKIRSSLQEPGYLSQDSASSSRTWPALPGFGQLFKNLASSFRIRPALQEPGQLYQDSAISSRIWPALPGFGQLFKTLATSPKIRPSFKNLVTSPKNSAILQEPGYLSKDSAGSSKTWQVFPGLDRTSRIRSW